MTTRTTPEAAMVAALDKTGLIWPVKYHRHYAVAILASLDGWTLVRDGDYLAGEEAKVIANECFEHNHEAEIVRLRKIEEAAREHIAWQYRVPGAPRFPLSMLRDALAAWR